MKRLWKNYGLTIVLSALFLVSWIIQTGMGWRQFQNEQQDHGKQATVFGQEGYIWDWGEATFENWQSEFLQLMAFVILSTYLIHKNSPQSRDSEDEMMAKVDDILKRVKRLESGEGKRAA